MKKGASGCRVGRRWLSATSRWRARVAPAQLRKAANRDKRLHAATTRTSAGNIAASGVSPAVEASGAVATAARAEAATGVSAAAVSVPVTADLEATAAATRASGLATGSHSLSRQ